MELFKTFISDCDVKLWYFLVISAVLFCIGIFGVLTRRNLVQILMSIELILNSAMINFVAFSAYQKPESQFGTIFAIFIIMVAACEVGIGLAIILSIYRNKSTTDVSKINILKW
ncbi:MAG: NADH-quinone oxidoreductase subunit NuoK [Actinomycetota bacterium]|nr:NADH-quinone oxidoreductase subunit NuoK [Actinomycetota bacterium]